MAFKGQKNGVEGTDGTNVPNSFNDLHLMYVYIIWGELGLCAEIFLVNTK
jgi:hypothetical protein